MNENIKAVFDGATVDGKFLMYKNRPLVREGNTIVYGNMDDKFILALTIMNEKEYMGKSIYFAGDLHWWTWIGSPVEEEIFYEKTYQHELSKIKDRHFDAAFVVLDPRQEERYWWGMHEFMKYANADVVFPMHFWKDYKLIDKFKQVDISKEYAHKIMSITHEGQVFEI